MKKIINNVIVLIICISFIMPSNIAYALPAEPLPPPEGWIPEVIEGGKGAINKAASGEYGPTVAYIIGAILGLYLVGETTVLAVTDMETTTKGFFDFMDKIGNPAIERIKDKAVWMYDTSITLTEHMLVNPVINLYEFFIPVKNGENEVPEEIIIPKTLKMYAGDYIQDYTGLMNMENGTYDKSIALFRKLVKDKYGDTVNIPDEYFRVNQGIDKWFAVAQMRTNAGYVIMVDNAIEDEYLTPNIDILKKNIDSGSSDYSEYIRVPRKTGYTAYYREYSTYPPLVEHLPDPTASDTSKLEIKLLYNHPYVNSDDSLNIYIGNAGIDLLYSSKDLTISITDRDEKIYIGNNEQKFTIKDTQIKRLAETNVDNINTIVVNDYLAYSLKDVDNSKIPTTDEIILPIIQADNVAREYGDIVLENELDATDMNTDIDPAVDEVNDIQDDIINQFNDSMYFIDNDTTFPVYILNGFKFVKYVFSGIWNGLDDYVVVLVFSATIGVTVLLLGFGLVKNKNNDTHKKPMEKGD